MKNKKIIQLTENDLEKIVKRIIKEDDSKEEDLINAAYELMYDLNHEDVEILDLQDAANILEDELYDGNHGSIMNKKIGDLLTNIYEIIGYPDAEDWDESEY